MASVKATRLSLTKTNPTVKTALTVLTKTNPTVKTAISGVGSGSLAGGTAGHRHGRGLMTAYRKGEFVFKKKNAIFHKREDPKDPSVLPVPS